MTTSPLPRIASGKVIDAETDLLKKKLESTRAAEAAAAPVSYTHLLIFYAGSNGKVNHVAIYIGNGRIVHAASRRSGIKTSTWNYRTPVAIRSMLD